MANTHLDAVVVGAGPNGLAAAITLAKAGRSVKVLEASATPGGGMRTAELTLPGYRHDVCSAFHPLAATSPFFRSLQLESQGLEFIHPPVPLAHPLDGGRAGLLFRSMKETTDHLGLDGPAWEKLIGWLVERWNRLGPNLLAPVLQVPNQPFALASFALRGLPPAELTARSFETPEAKALFAGSAAHGFLSLNRPFTASFGLILSALAHVGGWPIIAGGSDHLSKSMVTILDELGVEIECDHPVRSLNDLPPSTVVLFDINPAQLARIAEDELPSLFLSRLRRFRPGPGVFKLDYALSEPIPWTNEHCRQAGTVHVGGTLAEIVSAESDVAAGLHPDRPFVLVGQQSLFDPSRTPDNGHTLWAYCHVPNGSDRDMGDHIERQIERFAPGFRDTIVVRHRAGPQWFEDHNANNVGGDISGGSHTGTQLLARPIWSTRPYRTPNPRLFLCSASTPPGAGVHGMNGYGAARDVLASALA